MLTHVCLMVNFVRYIIKYDFIDKWLTFSVRVINSVVSVTISNISDLCINIYV